MQVSVGPDEFAALTTIFAPNGEVVGAGHTTASALLPVSGDYIVEIGNTGSTTDFTMNVRIPPLGQPAPNPPSGAQRIRFAAGTDNATVQGSIAPGTTTSYVLRAAAGQTMQVSVGPDEFAALTTIFAPNGEVVGAGHTTASALLPVGGDYIVEIGNTGSTTDFTMTVSIPPR
jgi:hypothetical protein